MPDTDLITLANKFAADAAKRDAAAMGRLVRAYLSMYKRLALQIEMLAEQVGSNQMTLGQLARLGRYNSLMRQIESELSDFAAYTKIELSASADEAVRRALADARSLIYAGAGGTLEVGFNTLPSAAVTRLLGFLQDGSPLYKRLSQLAPVNSAALRDLFVEGVGLGWNPRKIAASMRRQFGMGLVDALRFTRTANNYAYRESTRATYIANKDVVTGWIWLAAVGQPNTCMSCIRMHGTEHKNTERLNDHHNGRAEVAGNMILASSPTALETICYNGDVAVINTASGKFLTVTPDHPVLTGRGWVAAAFVKEGDDVISHAGFERASYVVGPDKNHVPTKIENVAGAFDMLRLGSVPKSAKHLNGNRRDGEIDVVYFNRFLWNSFNSASQQQIKEKFFGSGLTVDGSLPALSDSALVFEREWFAASGLLSSLDTIALFTRGHARSLEAIGIGNGSPFNLQEIESALDGRSLNIEPFSDSVLGHAGQIESADLVSRESDLIPDSSGNFDRLNFLSFGLVDALRFTRTANNYAYRESTRATYIANKDVVTGWIWLAAVGQPNTCMSCIRMHGTKHSNSERLNDHHNGRCAMLPIVKGFENPIKQSGEQWFNAQPEATQRALMGRDYHQAWKDGLYSFDEISMERPNDVYGNMRGVTPLWKLLGAEPPLRTR